MSSLTFIDLFAGVGGFRLGMEAAGHKCVGFVEIDKYARKSYKAIFDTKGEWTEHDIRNVRANNIPNADVWCFGFPCQDISISGKQDGIENGKRSSLFFAVTGLVRQLKKEDRPKYLFIENVKNLLSVNRGFDFAKLLIELDEIGYDAEWSVLDSADVIPQHRERVFIVGHLRGRGTRKVFPIRNGSEKDDGTRKHECKVNTITTRTGGAASVGTYVIESKRLPKKVKQIGNCMPTATRANPNQGRVYDPSGIAPSLTTMDGGNLQPMILQRGGGKNQGGSHEIAPTLTSNSWHENNLLYEDDRIRKLTPGECWRLQGFPDWAIDSASEVNSDSQLYKQAGNSVTVPVIYEIAVLLN